MLCPDSAIRIYFHPTPIEFHSHTPMQIGNHDDPTRLYHNPLGGGEVVGVVEVVVVVVVVAYSPTATLHPPRFIHIHTCP